MAVSIQQASANAFAAWLHAQMPDVTVFSRWPNFTRLPAKAISVVTAGARRDIHLDPHLVSATNSGSTDTVGIWQVAACFQPFQLDVWTTSHVDRDDIVARLDGFLRADASALTGAYNPNPVGNGVLIAVQDGWQTAGTIADFQFENPDTDDTGDEVSADQYRASYRGGAGVMLTVAKTTARQKLIIYQQLIKQTDQDAETTLYQVP